MSEYEKEEKALALIQMCLESARNPVCLCSFGKDSSVLLDLIMRVCRVDVIHFREPWFPKKFAYSQKRIQDLELAAHDYPPSFVEYMYQDGKFDIHSFYYVAGGAYLDLSLGARRREKGDEWVCAVDVLSRPTVRDHSFPWDVVFVGHKQGDDDAVSKKVQLRDLRVMGQALLVYPLREWTDKDVWEYTYREGLTYNIGRYRDGDDSANPDVFPTCFDCLDRHRRGEMVYCPVACKEIPNVCRSDEENEIIFQKLLKVVSK